MKYKKIYSTEQVYPLTNNVTGTLHAKYTVREFTDFNSSTGKRKYIVECAQRIIVTPSSAFSIAPGTITSYLSYPAGIQNSLAILPSGAKGSTGITIERIDDYEPKTLNSSVESSQSSDISQSSSLSRDHTVGSSYSQTNSYSTSANLGTFDGDLVGGVSGSASFTNSSSHFAENSESRASSSGNETESGSSMSIKDWACYASADPTPSNQQVTWVWAQTYPWNILEFNSQLSSSGEPTGYINLPKYVQNRLYNKSVVFPPSDLSQFGLNFESKARWVVCPNDLSGPLELVFQHTVLLAQGSHGVGLNSNQPNQLAAQISTTNTQNIESPTIALEELSLNPVDSNSGLTGAVVGFYQEKFVVAPSSGKAFKIFSDTNNLKVTGAGFSEGMTTSFKNGTVNLDIAFKVAERNSPMALYLKHWKTNTVGCKLSIKINNTTINRMVDTSENEGNEMTKITLRNNNIGSSDFCDYLVPGQNNIQITITPNGTVGNAGYQIRAISIE